MHSISFFNTAVSAGAIEAVSDILRSTFLSEGKTVEAFELGLANEAGMLHPVTVNSGTAALHLALVLAGVGPGDEVIIPAQTFVATGLAVLMVGATPVFADIEMHTGNIDVADIKRKISPATRAIMPVHWGGYPCDMDAISAVATAHNLTVIEDAAHAIGASYKGQAIGSISDFTCFSFQAIKHLTTGDGGAIACKDPADFNKAMTLRWFGIDRKNSPVGALGEREYNLASIGYKYHLNNYAAALGMANLKDLAANVKRRQQIAAHYDAELQTIAGLSPFTYHTQNSSSYWLYGIHVERRSAFIQKLQSHGIPASVVHLGIHKNDLFIHSSKHDIPVQVQFDASQIHIPVHNELTDEQVEAIVDCIKSGW